MGIAKFIEEVLADFELYGEFNDEWLPFVKGVNYNAFLLKRKQVNLDFEKE